MSATLESSRSAPPARKSVWAAMGVFAVALLALAAALVHIQLQPEEPQAAVLAAPVAATSPTTNTETPGGGK